MVCILAVSKRMKNYLGKGPLFFEDYWRKKRKTKNNNNNKKPQTNQPKKPTKTKPQNINYYKHLDRNVRLSGKMIFFFWMLCFILSSQTQVIIHHLYLALNITISISYLMQSSHAWESVF